jgi:hypothetical protein
MTGEDAAMNELMKLHREMSMSFDRSEEIHRRLLELERSAHKMFLAGEDTAVITVRIVEVGQEYRAAGKEYCELAEIFCARLSNFYGDTGSTSIARAA